MRPVLKITFLSLPVKLNVEVAAQVDKKALRANQFFTPCTKASLNPGTPGCRIAQSVTIPVAFTIRIAVVAFVTSVSKGLPS